MRKWRDRRKPPRYKLRHRGAKTVRIAKRFGKKLGCFSRDGKVFIADTPEPEYDSWAAFYLEHKPMIDAWHQDGERWLPRAAFEKENK